MGKIRTGISQFFSLSLRAGSLVWVGDKEPSTGEPGEKNEARKSEKCLRLSTELVGEPLKICI